MKVAGKMQSDSFVLDCSVAATWILTDEAKPATKELLSYLHDCIAVVPCLWHQEIGNALVNARKRGRITEQQFAKSFKFLSDLPITTETETHTHVFHKVVPLARTHSLTVYDATYLELALRRRIALATLDGELAQAAKAEGVTVLPA